jgi:Domain of unknown function (DUF4333)
VRPCVLAAALLFPAALGGCGSSTPRLNPSVVERAIARSIRTERGVKSTVHCPANVPRKAGTAFTCTAYLDVGSYPIAVTETNASGHVRYGNTAPLVILNIRKVESAITSSILSQRHLKAAVSCPAEVLEQAGTNFTCTASINGSRYPFAVTETDDNGHVRYVGR